MQVEGLLSQYYGLERFQRIRRALVTAPNHTCLRYVHASYPRRLSNS